MSKQRERSELEHLRAENRTLKKQIKHLKKQLSHKEKREHLYEDISEEIEDQGMEEDIAPKGKSCELCGKGVLVREKMGARILTKCTTCTYSKFTKG